MNDNLKSRIMVLKAFESALPAPAGLDKKTKVYRDDYAEVRQQVKAGIVILLGTEE